MPNKRDISISMARANFVVIFITIPVVILQFAVFVLVYGMKSLDPTWSPVVLLVAVLLGVIIH